MKATITKEDFSEKVEAFFVRSNSDIIDATIHVASKNGIEPELINKFLTDRLKDLIRNEALKKNMIRDEQTAVLPV